MKRLGGGIRGEEGPFGGCGGGISREGVGVGGSSLLIFLGQQRGRGALPELANTFSW